MNIDGTLSSFLPVTSDVPQGSVLVPLLFLIFVGDMLDPPSLSCCYCCADDTKLVAQGESLNRFLQDDLDSSKLWSWDN